MTLPMIDEPATDDADTTPYERRGLYAVAVSEVPSADVEGRCISSNWCEQCRHLFWTLSAFMLNGMGGWLVSLVVGYFMSEWVFR